MVSAKLIDFPMPTRVPSDPAKNFRILLANSNQWYFNKLVKILCHKTPYRCPHRLNLSSQSSRSCAGPNIKILKDKDLEFANSSRGFCETLEAHPLVQSCACWRMSDGMRRRTGPVLLTHHRLDACGVHLAQHELGGQAAGLGGAVHKAVELVAHVVPGKDEGPDMDLLALLWVIRLDPEPVPKLGELAGLETGVATAGPAVLRPVGPYDLPGCRLLDARDETRELGQYLLQLLLRAVRLHGLDFTPADEEGQGTVLARALALRRVPHLGEAQVRPGFLAKPVRPPPDPLGKARDQLLIGAQVDFLDEAPQARRQGHLELELPEHGKRERQGGES